MPELYASSKGEIPTHILSTNFLSSYWLHDLNINPQLNNVTQLWCNCKSIYVLSCPAKHLVVSYILWFITYHHCELRPTRKRWNFCTSISRARDLRVKSCFSGFFNCSIHLDYCLNHYMLSHNPIALTQKSGFYWEGNKYVDGEGMPRCKVWGQRGFGENRQVAAQVQAPATHNCNASSNQCLLPWCLAKSNNIEYRDLEVDVDLIFKAMKPNAMSSAKNVKIACKLYPLCN